MALTNTSLIFKAPRSMLLINILLQVFVLLLLEFLCQRILEKKHKWDTSLSMCHWVFLYDFRTAQCILQHWNEFDKQELTEHWPSFAENTYPKSLYCTYVCCVWPEINFTLLAESHDTITGLNHFSSGRVVCLGASPGDRGIIA